LIDGRLGGPHENFPAAKYHEPNIFHYELLRAGNSRGFVAADVELALRAAIAAVSCRFGISRLMKKATFSTQSANAA
jgi:hypothetical protein